MVTSRSLGFVGVFALLSIHGIYAEDAPSDAPPANDKADDEDPTTSLMKQLTIANSAEVLDERTFSVRDSKTKTKSTVRLGNVASIEQGSLSEEKHQEKVEAAKVALSQLVGQAVFLWKAAPDEYQPKSEDEDFVLADVWTADGRHVPTLLKKEGHLVASPTYESELARDILQAASGKEKQDAYAKLDEALKESNAKAEAVQNAQKAEEPAEPIGLGGWIGLLVVAALVVGALTNFGQEKKKKSPNRKKSSMEKVWSKIKGQ